MSRFLAPWRAFFASATDAPLAYGEAAGLMCLATLSLGRRVLDVGEGLRGNLFMLITGDSSVARKSTSVRYAAKMIDEVDPHRLGPSDYTMEGLFKWMTHEKDPETGKGRDKLTICSEEFGADLARRASYSATMAEDLCRLYDGGKFEKVRAKAESITIDKPRVNLLGAVAYPLLEQYLTIDDWFTGFLMRFVFVMPTQMRHQSLIQPRFPRALWDQAVIGLITIKDQLRNNLDPNGENKLALDPNAHVVYQNYIQRLQSEVDNRHIVATYLARFQVNVLKIALLYQLDIDPDQPVGHVAMNFAVHTAHSMCWPAFLHAYEIITAKSFEALLGTIIKRVRDSGAVPHRQLHEEFMKHHFFQRALQALIQGHVLESKIGLTNSSEPAYQLRP